MRGVQPRQVSYFVVVIAVACRTYRTSIVQVLCGIEHDQLLAAEYPAACNTDDRDGQSGKYARIRVEEEKVSRAPLLQNRILPSLGCRERAQIQGDRGSPSQIVSEALELELKLLCRPWDSLYVFL